MAERRLIFPDDHPYHPGKTLVIPEGTTQEELDAQIDELSRPPSAPATSGGFLSGVKNFGKGILEGYGTLGSMGDPETGVGVGGTMGGAIGSKEVPFEPKSPYPPPAQEDPIGRYARAAGQNVPGMVTTPGGPIPKLLYGPGAGLLGEGASDLVKKYAPGGESIAPYAKMGAAMFGPGAIQRIRTPNTVDPRRVVNNQVIKQELGPLAQTAGQFTGNKPMMSKELKARPTINEDQTDAFHQRVTAPTGASTTNITPEWLNETGKSIGNTYDSLERSTHIAPGVNPILPTGSMGFAVPEISNIEKQRPQETQKVLDIIRGVDDKLVPHAGAMPGEKVHSALFNAIGTGRSIVAPGVRGLPGEQYRRLRSNLYSAAEGSSTNEEAHTLRQYAHALDNAMTRTNPDWGQAWGANNRRFANFRMAQNAANANKGKDQFSAKQWLTAGHKTMGPQDFANSESGRFVDAYSKVMPELKDVKSKPSALTQLAIGGLGALGAGHLGVPAGMEDALGAAMQVGEPVVGAILGLEAAKPISQLLANRSVLPQMNPLLQLYRKNQALPAVNDRAMLMRALLNAPQNKEPEAQR